LLKEADLISSPLTEWEIPTGRKNQDENVPSDKTNEPITGKTTEEGMGGVERIRGKREERTH